MPMSIKRKNSLRLEQIFLILIKYWQCILHVLQHIWADFWYFHLSYLVYIGQFQPILWTWCISNRSTDSRRFKEDLQIISKQFSLSWPFQVHITLSFGPVDCQFFQNFICISISFRIFYNIVSILMSPENQLPAEWRQRVRFMIS